MKSGAGLLMDQELRALFKEYNNRLLHHGPESMPSSFTVAHRFFRPDADRVLELLPELDHAFSFEDFLDFATSTDAPVDPLADAEKFKDSCIYSYTCTDDPRDLRFTVGDGRECGIAGVSMVRTGNEFTVLVVGGAPVTPQDIDGSSTLLKEVLNTSPAPGREWLNESMKRVAGDVTWKLRGFDDLQRVLAFARFGLESRTLQIRLLAIDTGPGFDVATDDPSVFGRFDDEEAVQTALSNSDEELEKHAVLFETCKLMTLLPAYFSFKIQLVRDRVRATKVASKWDQERAEKALKGEDGVAPPAADGVRFKRVASLEVVSSISGRVARRFTAPQFQVDVSGFWRSLPNGRVGRDESGNPIEGKTWVKSHVRWRERPKRQITVLVKSRLSIARAIVESERLAGNIAAATHVNDPAKSTSNLQNRVTREEAFEERRKLTAVVRWAVLQRDDFRCQTCGADAAGDRNVRLDVDHITPVIAGGKTELSNLRTLCSRCNNGKGDSI